MKISGNVSFILLKKIVINNYKTYQNLEIPLIDNVITLVGPNECGKTNLLESIYYLENYRNLSKNDTCLYCENYWTEEPNFVYYLNPKCLGLKDIINDIILKVRVNQVEFLHPPEKLSDKEMVDKHSLSFPVGGGVMFM